MNNTIIIDIEDKISIYFLENKEYKYLKYEKIKDAIEIIKNQLKNHRHDKIFITGEGLTIAVYEALLEEEYLVELIKYNFNAK